jgi:hypothetical protein
LSSYHICYTYERAVSSTVVQRIYTSIDEDKRADRYRNNESQTTEEIPAFRIRQSVTVREIDKFLVRCLHSSRLIYIGSDVCGGRNVGRVCGRARRINRMQGRRTCRIPKQGERCDWIGSDPDNYLGESSLRELFKLLELDPLREISDIIAAVITKACQGYTNSS